MSSFSFVEPNNTVRITSSHEVIAQFVKKHFIFLDQKQDDALNAVNKLSFANYIWA